MFYYIYHMTLKFFLNHVFDIKGRNFDILLKYVNSLLLKLTGLCVTEKQFSYFSTKTYVVGTQKNRLNETQSIC